MTYIALAQNALPLITPIQDAADRLVRRMQDVRDLRTRMLDDGFYPVASAPGDKHPREMDWPSRKDPCPALRVTQDRLNTGIECTGLRPIDIDIDDRDDAATIRMLAEKMLGSTLARVRANSSRCVLLYRSAEDEAPHKRALSGDGHSKETPRSVEVLGWHNFLLCWGKHPSGAEYQWEGEIGPGSGHALHYDELPAVTEEQITSFLDVASTIIGGMTSAEREAKFADIRRQAEANAKHQPEDYHPMSVEAVESALDQIPYEGYAQWIRLASACHAANPSTDDLFKAWLRRSPSDSDDADVDRMWRNPLRSVGAGTLIALARANNPHWISPDAQARIGEAKNDQTKVREAMQRLLDKQKGKAPFDHTPKEDAPEDLPADELPLPLRASEADQKLPRKPRFKYLTAGEAMRLPPPEWLVRDLLPTKALACIYGAPGSFKSFLALDLALFLATNRSEWFGHKAKPCSVLYIAAEGAGGMSKRIAAWTKANNINLDHANFTLLPEAVNLMTADDPAALLDDVNDLEMKFDLIFVDTLARSMGGGDEMLAKDFGAVTDNCTCLAEALSATVVLIHHTGKDASRGPRGSSAIRGNLDTVIEVTREEGSSTALARVVKQKDGEDGFSFAFGTKKVEWIAPGHGIVSSLVVTPPQPADPEAKLRTQIVNSLDVGTHNLASICTALSLSPGGKNRDRIKSAVPDHEPIQVRTEDGRNLTMRRDDTRVIITDEGKTNPLLDRLQRDAERRKQDGR